MPQIFLAQVLYVYYYFRSKMLAILLVHIITTFHEIDCHSRYSSLISSRFPKLEFTNQTREVLKGFAPMEDLKLQNICHVIPFVVVDNVLSSVLLDRSHKLKPGTAVNESQLLDLRVDIFKVDNDAAYLRKADMRSKIRFFRENASQRTRYDEAVMKLKTVNETKAYNETVRNIVSLLYNAPANLRVSPTTCINNGTTSYEDPNLRNYDGISYQNLQDSGFTEQSKMLAKKYRLGLLRDVYGYIQTTDRKKVLLNPTLSQSLEQINKGLNVFQLQ